MSCIIDGLGGSAEVSQRAVRVQDSPRSENRRGEAQACAQEDRCGEKVANCRAMDCLYGGLPDEWSLERPVSTCLSSFAKTRDKAYQGQTDQQHGVGFGFRDNTRDTDENLPMIIDIPCIT